MLKKFLSTPQITNQCLTELAVNYKIITHRRFFVMNATIYVLVMFIIFIVLTNIYLTLKNKKGK